MKKLILILAVVSLLPLFSFGNSGQMREAPIEISDSLIFVVTAEDSILSEFFVITMKFEYFAEKFDHEKAIAEARNFNSLTREVDDLYILFLVHNWIERRKEACGVFPKSNYNLFLNSLKRRTKRLIRKEEDLDYLNKFRDSLFKAIPSHKFLKYLDKKLIDKKLKQ